METKKAMNTDAFDVAKVFLYYRWNIHALTQGNLCRTSSYVTFDY